MNVPLLLSGERTDRHCAARPTPFWKRALDLSCCILLSPVVAPAFMCVALWIKLTSAGPVFFKQDRIGYRGQTFRCFKFRTMRADADRSAHCDYTKILITSNAPMVKLDATGDTRLIAGAWLLRASGLDELPQIINILRGEMSLVGPRPCIPYEYECYLPRQKARFASVPGLTGLWQVSGKNRTTFEEMIRLDVSYGETKSLWLDLKILFLTLPAVIGQVLEARVLRSKAVPSARPPVVRNLAQLSEHMLVTPPAAPPVLIKTCL
jgi:lipopolysaccharide/colanic/teichoic acid biosynthesis glycosyltransferase